MEHELVEWIEHQFNHTASDQCPGLFPNFRRESMNATGRNLLCRKPRKLERLVRKVAGSSDRALQGNHNLLLRHRGFTLIELLVVIAIIAILAAMILPVLVTA